MLEPHDVPSNYCVWMGVLKESVARITHLPARVGVQGMVGVQGRMAGWQDGDLSCRVYEQNCKLARIERQDREKKEADNKAGQGCSVTRPKDEEPIPSTHCDTRTSSVQSPNLHAIQVSQLVPQRDVSEVHDGSPCDDNGGAGLGSYHKRKSCIMYHVACSL